jgi:thiamine biosynthesis lipoprotein
MRLAKYNQTNLALGSDVALTLVSDKPFAEIDTIFAGLWHYIYAFERSFSRFIPKSEISLFNRSAGVRTKITPEFKDLLSAAKAISEKTGGVYNPFILPALQRTGYKRSAVPGYEHDVVDDYSRRRVGSIEELQIGQDWAEIPSDTAIDMGGCGKGYLADKLGRILMDIDVANYRLSLGGDIATAGTDELGDKWLIGIQDATNLGGEIQKTIECPVKPFAVATSGTFKRKGYVADKDWHHIIDPITLESAVTDVRLATVCADMALQADVLASCAVIVGSKNAASLIKPLGASAMLLQGDSQNAPFEKHFGHFTIRQSTGRGL